MAEASELPAHQLHPKILTLWRLGFTLVSLTAAVVTGFLLAGASAAWGFAGAITVGALGAILTATIPPLRYARWRYEIRERDVFLSKGTIVHTMALIPFDRIQMVQTTQGPLDRRFALMQLVIRTAAGQEAIPGLTISEAERLRSELSAIAGSDSV